MPKTARITTAVELSKTQQQQVVKKLQTKLQFKSAEFLVQPEILGGITVTIGSDFYDYSLRSKLQTINQSLTS